MRKSWRGLGVCRYTHVARLKREEGPPLLAQGSTDLVQTLLADDLVDQINIFTFPPVLGQGKKLFGGGSRAAALRLTASRISPHGILIAKDVRDGAVKTGDFAMHPPRPAEVARREKMKREGWVIWGRHTQFIAERRKVSPEFPPARPQAS